MVDPTFRIETPRLIISQYREDSEAHCQFLLDLFNSPSVLQFNTDRNIHTIEDAGKFLRNGAIRTYEKLGFGPYVVSLKPAINTAGKDADKETLSLIGDVGLFRNDLLDAVEIGYSVLPAFEGKGYATEAAKALLKYAVDVLEKSNVIAMTREANDGSKSVMDKIGMVYYGKVQLPGTDFDSLVYAIRGTHKLKMVKQEKALHIP